MKNLICLLFITVFISCLEKKETKNETISYVKNSVTATDSVEEDLPESDCIFENKPKELTTDWLKEISIDKFSWDDKNKKAVVKIDQDTLFVFKDGCNHLEQSVELRTANVYKDILDMELLQKINEIACKFKFDNYCNKLINNQFEKTKVDENTFFLEFKDDDPDDNLISEGIHIFKNKNSLNIIISEYYN